jgi:hypothetical protein
VDILGKLRELYNDYRMAKKRIWVGPIVIESEAFQCLDCGLIEIVSTSYPDSAKFHGLPIRVALPGSNKKSRYTARLATDYLLKGDKA